MRVGLITTLSTNIGDDFIREGIKHVLREVIDDEIDFIAVNKHEPLTVYPSWHPARWTPRGKRTAARCLSPLGFSRFRRCELIVQCGAPVLWPGCHACEWALPIWRQVVGRLSRKKVKVLNLAAGSCYPWTDQPQHLDDADAAFAREIMGYCKLTTAREPLAQQLFNRAGGDVPMFCCSALLAARGHEPKPTASGPVLINYMPLGGHYDWDQSIDQDAWRQTLRDLIGRLRAKHVVKFICHSPGEVAAAGELDPTLEVLAPRTPAAYFSVVADAKAAVCNRLHASVGMAGLGIPSVAVGNDTRLLMPQTVGITSLFVEDATAGRLEREVAALIGRRDEISRHLLARRDETWDQYVDAVRGAIS